MATSVSRLTPPPPKLDEIIQAVRKVPADVFLKDLSGLSLRDESPEGIHEALYQQFAQLPDKEFERHIWRAVAPEFLGVLVRISPAAAKRKILRSWKQSQPRLARFADQVYREKIKAAYREYEFVRVSNENLLILIRAVEQIGTRARDFFYIAGSVRIDIDEQGVVEIQRDRFTQAVDEVDATRIRICENCNHIFWAGRNDATCCSTSCHTNIRNQISRYLKKHDYLPGARLTKKEQAEKAALINAWRSQRRERNPYGNL